MGVAPGGLIKQCILEDTHPASIWERDRTVCFNVQILNSEMFQQVTGKAPPSTPISAKTYADQGLPLYKIYGETSTIKGDFDGIKSVKELDKVKNKNGKRENEGDEASNRKKRRRTSAMRRTRITATSKMMAVIAMGKRTIVSTMTRKTATKTKERTVTRTTA